MGAADSETTIYSKGSTGIEVYAIQQRLIDLGYLQYRPTGKYSDMTANAVRKFQQVNGIAADGQVGTATNDALFSDDAKRCIANPNFKRQTGAQSNGGIKAPGLLSSWEKIDPLLPVGSVIAIKDFNSDISFNVERVGGDGCAQVKTISAADYAAFQEVFGGETWEHRAVIATVSGTDYAASLFGMPTGNESAAYPNTMNGHTFLYFQNSVSDIEGLPDEEHMGALLRIGSTGAATGAAAAQEET